MRSLSRKATEAGDGRARIRLAKRGGSIELSRAECWELYVGLGDDAPFVRNQLKVVRAGGSGDVSVTTAEERKQVLAALARCAGTGGLSSLKAALDDFPQSA